MHPSMNPANMGEDVLAPDFVPAVPATLYTRWLAEDDVRPICAAICRTWMQCSPAAASGTSVEDLAAIQYDIWSAAREGWPTPAVCLLSVCALPAESITRETKAAVAQNLVIGVLCGFLRHGHRDFFIHGMAVHPWYDHAPTSLSIRGSLLEAAIDVSVEAGYFGWVSCAPEAEQAPLWRSLGFSPHDAFTYRRMGYFEGPRGPRSIPVQ